MSLILPDPRLEAPELLEPGRKPVGNVQIDWDHEASAGLLSAGLLSSLEWKDLVQNRPETGALTGTAAYTVGTGGTGVSYPAGENYQALISASRMASQDGHTFIIVRSCNDATDRASSAWGTDTSENTDVRMQAHLPYLSPNLVYFDYGGVAVGANRLTWDGYSKTQDKVDVWGFRGGSQGMQIWYDGDLKASHGSSASFTPSAIDFRINDGPEGGDNQTVYAAFLWVRQLPDSLLKSMTLDPYQLLIPA